jgi:hypothetical protein
MRIWLHLSLAGILLDQKMRFHLFSAFKRQPAEAAKHVKHQRKFFSAFLPVFRNIPMQITSAGRGRKVGAHYHCAHLKLQFR